LKINKQRVRNEAWHFLKDDSNNFKTVFYRFEKLHQ